MGKWRAAAGWGAYDAFITVDRNMPFQQNVQTLQLGIIILKAASITYEVRRVFMGFPSELGRAPEQSALPDTDLHKAIGIPTCMGVAVFAIRLPHTPRQHDQLA